MSLYLQPLLKAVLPDKLWQCIHCYYSIGNTNGFAYKKRINNCEFSKSVGVSFCQQVATFQRRFSCPPLNLNTVFDIVVRSPKVLQQQHTDGVLRGWYFSLNFCLVIFIFCLYQRPPYRKRRTYPLHRKPSVHMRGHGKWGLVRDQAFCYHVLPLVCVCALCCVLFIQDITVKMGRQTVMFIQLFAQT